MRGRVVAVAGLAGLLLVWWLAGLGRAEADPLDFFTRAQVERAAAYRVPRSWAFLAATLVGLGVLAALALTPLGRRLLRPALRLPWWAAAAAAGLLTVGAEGLGRLPLAFWSGFVHERAWGFSTQSAPGWLGDWAKAVGIRGLVTAVAAVGLLGLVRLLPRAWPAAAAPLAALLVVGGAFLWPVLVEPAFNRFEPLADPARAREYRDLAERAGVPVREVLVADASRRTRKENAYVSGLGGTRRLVLYDTLLARAEPEEVRLVVAHELAHRRARHVEKGTLLGAAAAAGAVVVLWVLLRSRRVLRAAGASSAADPRVVPLVVLAVALMTLAGLPVANRISRGFEEEADRFALRLTGERDAYVGALRGLALRNLSNLDPGPLTYRFLFTHPSVPERLSYAFEGGQGTG